jgi:hypothetical protein
MSKSDTKNDAKRRVESEKQAGARIEFAPNYSAVLKITATGLMPKGIAAHWLETHASAREKIEDAKTAKEVKEILMSQAAEDPKEE